MTDQLAPQLLEHLHLVKRRMLATPRPLAVRLHPADAAILQRTTDAQTNLPTWPLMQPIDLFVSEDQDRHHASVAYDPATVERWRARAIEEGTR